MNPDFAAAFLVSGLYRLVEYHGMTHADAFDRLAATAALPEFQQMIVGMQATTAGRALLRQTIGYWDAEGLPCPWDNQLDLTPGVHHAA